MSTITFERAGFHYSDPYAEVFHGLSLSIDSSWRTAIIGRNGRGKSTLLRLIAAEIAPTRGALTSGMRALRLMQPQQSSEPLRTVVRRAIAPFDVWEQEMERLLGEATEESLARYGDILEEYEHAGGFEIDAAIARELAGLDIDAAMLERSYATLSGGEQTRAMIAALFLVRDAFPLLDEPTNHLDVVGRRVLAEYLLSKRGFILVSHDRELLDRCIDHVIAIERDGVRVIAGNYSTWRAQHELETAAEEHRNGVLRREITALERAAKRTRSWSMAAEREKQGAPDKGYITHKAAKIMKRALQVEARADEALDEKRSLLKNVDRARSLRIESSSGASDLLCALDDVTIAFDGRPIIEGFSMAVHKGERIALVGANGSGKTSVVSALVGELEVAAGRVHRPSRLRIGRSYQLPRWASGDLRTHIRAAMIDETRLRHLMAAMGVVGEIFDRPLETFSEGERKKVDLCVSLMTPADLYIWDEPMNYIDILSREQIEEAIVEHAPTMLFIEHDERFIHAVATRVLELSK